MLVRPAFGLILACSLTTALGETVPKEKIDLLADPSLKDWVFHLNEKNSLSTKREEVARVEKGVLQITGKGMGYLRTTETYKDYHLVAEYKWGERTWSKRADRARDCGLLLHCHGPDGVFGGTWPACVQTQMLEGSMGDINVLQGKGAPTQITIEVEKDAKGKTRWKKGGEATTFPLAGKSSASIVCKTRSADWKDVKGFRGKDDVDHPVGEWNRLEVICKGGSYRVFLNGVLVNEGRDATPSTGAIGIQSEWAECWFRRLELWPLEKFKEKWEPQAASTNTGYSETGESILPRRFPFGPAESAAHWRIDGDYELQLVASEPLTCDPVDVVWDERGRMFVAEMGDYPSPPEGGPNLSRIRLLLDKDRDGRMDHAVTWADNLDHVQGLLPMRGGLLATTRTAILFLRDTDGDDRADEITPLFHANDPRHNQLQVASPRWGPDNAIYLNNGIDGKEIYPHRKPEAKVQFGGLNLRYDPYSGEIKAVTGKGQFGASFDDFGRHFYCSNRNPIMFSVMPLEAVRRNPLARITQGHEDIQPAGSAVWPVALSHTTAAAHAGTHTAACGLGVYRGDLMPDLRGNIFVCDPTAQLVTRNMLLPKGASFNAARIDEKRDFLDSDEASFTAGRTGAKRDFLVSADEWCRPVQVRNGPDGALYICDMYRRFIDHAMYFPDEFSKTNYMRAGFDHGRIWRLVPKGSQAPPITPLPELDEDLISLLESENAWQRIHAQRLLVERRDLLSKPSLLKLKALLTKGGTPQSKIHALWTIAGLGQLELESIRSLLKEADSGVVENALLAAYQFFKEDGSLPSYAAALCQHHDARIRFLAVALSPRGADPAGDDPAIYKMLRDDNFDLWVRRAILSSHGDRAPLLVRRLLQDPGFLAVPLNGRDDTLREFAAATASQGNPEEIGSIADLLLGDPRWWHFSIVRGLSEGLPRGPLKARGSLGNFCATEGARFDPVLTILQRAGHLALDPESPEADRLAAIPLVVELGFEEALGVIERLLSPTEPALVQAAACRSLGRFPHDQVADFLFKRWADLGPLPLREALGILTRRSSTALRLMEMMKAGEINKALMPPMQRWSYCRSGNAKIRGLAVELFGTPDADRGKVIADYEGALATLKGEAARGREVFQKAACIACHRVGDLGTEVGPGLADVRLKLPSALLTDILDPNRMMEERWTSYTVKTTDGRTLIGLVTGEGATSLRLTTAGGVTVSLARSEISAMTSTGQSLMPVGLEGTISRQEMADLIAFLKKP